MSEPWASVRWRSFCRRRLQRDLDPNSLAPTRVSRRREVALRSLSRRRPLALRSLPRRGLLPRRRLPALPSRLLALPSRSRRRPIGLEPNSPRRSKTRCCIGRSRNTGRNTRSSTRTAPDVGGAGSAKSGRRSSSAMKSSRLFFCQLSHTASPQVGPCQVHHSRRSQDVGQVAVREAASSWQDVGRRLSDLRIRSNDGQVDHLSTAH